MSKKVLKHPTLIANSLEGDLMCLKELLKGTEPWHHKENINFILEHIEKEITRLREWCEDDYIRNMPEDERKLWEAVKDWKRNNKTLTEFMEWYGRERPEIQKLQDFLDEYEESMKGYNIKDC